LIYKYVRKLIIATAVLLLTSCASTGPAFSGLDTAPPDKALVYIFRPSTFTLSLRSIDVSINGAQHISLSNAGYTIAYLEPGRNIFEQSMNKKLMYPENFKDKRKIEIDLVAGETYFIEFNPTSAIGGSLPKDSSASASTVHVIGPVGTAFVSIPIAFGLEFGTVEKSRALEELKNCNYQQPEK
jgi:hypothetical protein